MEFSAQLEELEAMMTYIRSSALSLGFTEAVIPKILLACEEAVVNIIYHAYPGEKGQLSIECGKKNGRLEVVVRDQGRAFSPIDAEINPQLDVPVKDRKVGGLGIFFIRKVIDDACYQREGSENILRLTFSSA